MTVARGTPAVAARLRKAVATLGLPDASLLSFYLFAIVGLAVVPRDARLDFHLALIVGLAVAYGGGIFLLRAQPPDRHQHLRRIPRRFLTMILLFGMYFQLRWIIPALHSGSVDALLSDVDSALFGAPIAVLIAPYQTRFWVEWFSFFYWCYFYIIGAYVFAHVFFDRDGRHFTPLAAGLIMIHAPLGWLGYISMPGFGPYEYLRPALEPLPSGLFLRMSDTAYNWGPLRDIFPSMHTAVMTFLSIHAIRNWRRHLAYRIIAVPLTFWALQIVIATLYCRWHYTVDVAAGLALAVFCTVASEWLSRRWAAFRIDAGEFDPWF